MIVNCHIFVFRGAEMLLHFTPTQFWDLEKSFCSFCKFPFIRLKFLKIKLGFFCTSQLVGYVAIIGSVVLMAYLMVNFTLWWSELEFRWIHQTVFNVKCYFDEAWVHEHWRPPWRPPGWDWRFKIFVWKDENKQIRSLHVGPYLNNYRRYFCVSENCHSNCQIGFRIQVGTVAINKN